MDIELEENQLSKISDEFDELTNYIGWYGPFTAAAGPEAQEIMDWLEEYVNDSDYTYMYRTTKKKKQFIVALKDINDAMAFKLAWT